MRIRKPIKIDDREYVIRELTVREIINLFQEATENASKVDGEADNTGLDFFRNEAERLINLAFEGTHKPEDFIDMAPSELDSIYQKFREVNEVFFRIALSVGIEKILDELREVILSDFSALLVGSSKLGTLMRSTTGTPTSLPQ